MKSKIWRKENRVDYELRERNLKVVVKFNLGLI